LSRVKVYAFAHDGTTNLLEGFNSQLKRALHNYDGLNEANKKKFIDGFINTKKVGWNNQPTKCPFRLILFIWDCVEKYGRDG